MRSALLNIMVQAATKAGRSLSKDFGEVENLQVSVKGPADFVSNADKRAEQIVFEELQKARPTYAFLGEEGTEAKGTDGQHRWIVDPLDGTTNFLHGIPMFAVAIALERNQEIVASVIYNPVMDELYTAEKGGGAWLNDRKRLRVGGRKHLADTVIVTGINSRGRTSDLLQLRQLGPCNTGRGRHPPHRFGLDRSRLGRGWPLRWLLGSRPRPLGRGARPVAAEGSWRRHFGFLRHARRDLERRGRCRQREHPGPAAQDHQVGAVASP